MPQQKLTKFIDAASKSLDVFFCSDKPILTAIDICRTIEFFQYFVYFGLQNNQFRKVYYLRHGYPFLLQKAYSISNTSVEFQYAPSVKKVEQIAESVLMTAGRLSVIRQIIEQSEKGLLELLPHSENVFEMRYLHKNSGVEQIENESLNSYFRRRYEAISRRMTEHQKERVRLKRKMRYLVRCEKNNFIDYSTTLEIDRCFTEAGHLRMISTQLYDLFEDTATFGGIEYRKYVLVLQELIAGGLKHLEYCYILKDNCPEINLRNIVGSCYCIEDLILQYADYLKLSHDEVKQVFECLTVSNENIDCHIKDLQSFSPVFVQVSDTHVMRSVYGSNNKPFMFLQRELKRRYEIDYHKNCNREVFFRNELYTLIKSKSAFQNDILTVNESVWINEADIATDIDAVIFDKRTKQLGLFQLKWQEVFAHDLKDRRNRLAKFKKAEEWVEKVQKWVLQKDGRALLENLNIADKLSENAGNVSEVFIFVINRYNAHFTGFTPSDKAVWASWYLMMDVMQRISGKIKDPLKALHTQLKLNSPSQKSILNSAEGFTLNAGEFKIYYKAG